MFSTAVNCHIKLHKTEGIQAWGWADEQAAELEPNTEKQNKKRSHERNNIFCHFLRELLRRKTKQNKTKKKPLVFL